MTTERPELHRLCGLKETPTSGTHWHAVIIAGLPAIGVRRMARAIGVKVADMADLLGLDESIVEDREAILSRDASNMLYRVGLAFTRTLVKNTYNVEKAASWLRTAQPTMKDHIPILLLQSHVGTEYVFAAIERMEVPKDQVIHQDEAPDAGTAEFEHHMAEDEDEDENDDEMRFPEGGNDTE